MGRPAEKKQRAHDPPASCGWPTSGVRIGRSHRIRCFRAANLDVPQRHANNVEEHAVGGDGPGQLVVHRLFLTRLGADETQRETANAAVALGLAPVPPATGTS